MTNFFGHKGNRPTAPVNPNQGFVIYGKRTEIRDWYDYDDMGKLMVTPRLLKGLRRKPWKRKQ